MLKSYLLTGPTKKNFKKKTKLIYFNKFAQKLYFDKKINGACKTYNLNGSSNLSFNKNSLGYIRKKISQYISQLTLKLNKLHQTKFNEEYWSLLLENYLYVITIEIFINQRIIEDNKKKLGLLSLLKEKIYVKKSNSIEYFFYTIAEDQNFSKFVKSKILTCYLEKSKSFFKYIQSSDSAKVKKNYFNNIIKFFVKAYIKIFSPVVIIQPYFGKKNCLNLLIKSLGRIIVIHRDHLLPHNLDHFTKNVSARQELSVREEDLFDKMFNQINNEFFPASYLENYKKNIKKLNNLNKFIRVLGCAISIYYDDFFKILAAQIKVNNGKLITFQHGGKYNIVKFSIFEEFKKKYSDKLYLWSQSNSIGNTFLPKLENYKKKSGKRNKILIVPTNKKLSDNINHLVHLSYDQRMNPKHKLNFQFFDKLKKNLKDLTYVNMFPDNLSQFNKKIWQSNNFKNSQIITGKYFYKQKWFKDTRIVILDDISTPLYESLYLNIPTIIVCNELSEFNKRFKTMLKKLSFYFENINKASNFINKNYENIDTWWRNVLNSSDFKKFKKQLFIDKGFNPNNSLTREILELNSS